MKQKTIGNSFFLEGIALHTGLNVKLTVYPAPADHGIIICRTDVAGKPCIEAVVDNVGHTVRGTVLMNERMQVGTVEHALAFMLPA